MAHCVRLIEYAPEITLIFCLLHRCTKNQVLQAREKQVFLCPRKQCFLRIFGRIEQRFNGSEVLQTSPPIFFPSLRRSKFFEFWRPKNFVFEGFSSSVSVLWVASKPHEEKFSREKTSLNRDVQRNFLLKQKTLREINFSYSIPHPDGGTIILFLEN